MIHETADVELIRRARVPLGILKILLAVLGVSALLPGIELMREPSGRGIRFPEGTLDGSPFADYFIPGLLLSLFMGVLPLVAVWALWKKRDLHLPQRFNPFPRQHWAWTLAFISGLALTTWIIVQVFMVPYFFLQPILGIWGIAIIGLCFEPRVKAAMHIKTHKP